MTAVNLFGEEKRPAKPFPVGLFMVDLQAYSPERFKYVPKFFSCVEELALVH